MILLLVIVSYVYYLLFFWLYYTVFLSNLNYFVVSVLPEFLDRLVPSCFFSNICVADKNQSLLNIISIRCLTTNHLTVLFWKPNNFCQKQNHKHILAIYIAKELQCIKNKQHFVSVCHCSSSIDSWWIYITNSAVTGRLPVIFNQAPFFCYGFLTV